MGEALHVRGPLTHASSPVRTAVIAFSIQAERLATGAESGRYPTARADQGRPEGVFLERAHLSLVAAHVGHTRVYLSRDRFAASFVVFPLRRRFARGCWPRRRFLLGSQKLCEELPHFQFSKVIYLAVSLW